MYGFGQISFQRNYIPDNSPGINSYDECKEWYSKPFDKSKWSDTNQWGGWNSKRLQCEFGLEDKTITLSQSGPALCVTDNSDTHEAYINTNLLSNDAYRAPVWYALKKLYQQKQAIQTSTHMENADASYDPDSDDTKDHKSDNKDTKDDNDDGDDDDAK